MLDFIRRQSSSFLSWIILGAIALAMGIFFGGPSDMLAGGSADGIAKVYGTQIRNEDFNFQFNLATRFGLIPKEPKMREMMGVNEELIDGMVERVLLAHEAEQMGLAATNKEAEDMVLDGHVMLLGQRREWLGPDEKFNYEIFTKNWLDPMRVAEPNYLEQQSQELLAQALRNLMSASVLVPETEVRREYEQNANTLSLRYARYEFAAFANLADPTTAQLDAYVQEHREQLEKRYESQKTRFTDLPKQARLSLVKADATEEGRGALEASRAGILDGSRRFSAVAEAQSSHDTAAAGGDYGWIDEQSEAASDLPDAVRQAIPGLEIGAVSEIIEADGALWLLKVHARREGDVPLDEALRELAEDEVRDQLARDLAQRAAEEDQNAVAAGNPLTEVFSSPGALGETTLFGGSNIEDLPVEGEAPDEGEATDEGEAPTEGDTPAAEAGDAVAGLSRPKAELRSTGPFVKGQRIPTLGTVPGLVDDAWAYDGDMELLDGIYEVAGALVVAGVESKQEATDEEYAEQRDAIYDRLRRMKAAKVVGTWASHRCFDAKGQGDIKVSEGTVKRLTTYDTKSEDGKDEGEDAPKPTHAVCDRVGGGGGLLMSRYR